MSNKAPLILLFSLTLILAFILGIRYGQHVETTNKQNALIASLTPAATVMPQKQATYRTYSHKPCRVQFVVPDTLMKQRDSSSGASFKDGSDEVLSFSCDRFATGTAKLNPYTGKTVYFTVADRLKALIDNSLTFLR